MKSPSTQDPKRVVPISCMAQNPRVLRCHETLLAKKEALDGTWITPPAKKVN